MRLRDSLHAVRDALSLPGEVVICTEDPKRSIGFWHGVLAVSGHRQSHAALMYVCMYVCIYVYKCLVWLSVREMAVAGQISLNGRRGVTGL